MAFQLEEIGCTNFQDDDREDPILLLSNRLINLSIPENEPSIFTAVRYGDIRKIESEIAHNVDLNQTFDDDSYGVQASSMAHRVKLSGYSVIHLAALHCTPEIFEMLLDSGADKDAVDKQLRTPLHLATIAGRTCIVKLLIQKGAQIDVQSASGRTPLLEAVFNEDPALASILIEAGANIDIQDTKGTSVLHHLCLHRRPNLIFLDYVLSKKCNVDINNPKGSTPLMFACAMKAHFSQKIVKLLLHKGAKINQIDKDGHSAINFVVEHKSNFERTCLILLFLIQHGSSTTHVDKKGMTLLDFTMRNMSLGCMKCLLLSDVQRDAKAIMEHPDMEYLFDRIPSFKEWLVDELYTPRSLMRLCRQTVRSRLSAEGLLKISELDLPKDLQDFIYCKDIQLNHLVP